MEVTKLKGLIPGDCPKQQNVSFSSVAECISLGFPPQNSRNAGAHEWNYFPAS
jgi:hypothetical protein